ncbi:MAG TPA: glycosyl hydrolase family 8, partial [Polyangiaceae bacterium]
VSAAGCSGSKEPTTNPGSGGDSSSAGGSSANGNGGTPGSDENSSGGATPSAGGSSSSGAATGGSTGKSGPRMACAAPAGYRNLFVEILGKTPTEVDNKIAATVRQLFHGGSDESIYFELGSDQAYVQDIASNDVRSEGQSYGMTVAVQMDMKAEFDKLWNYAAKCMRQSTGLFAWQMNAGTCTPKSTGAAPDGEEYFAMALMLASRRWGDTGAINYGSEAKKVMTAMLAARPGGEFNSDPTIVSFGPFQEFSDPSYVLPLFYSEWACFDTAHSSVWNKATTDGRTFFKNTTNATTGLAPYQANWNGTPRSGNGNFNADSWRVPMNIMMDYNLNGADPWQATYATTHAAFWVKEGLDSYGNGYNLDGSGKSGMHGQGMVGVNAMLAFALPPASGKPFLQAAWDAGTPSGTYRYYDGCLYMLSMLHLSGKFSLFL